MPPPNITPKIRIPKVSDGQDVFFFLLSTRWLALVPPLVSIFYEARLPSPPELFLLALSCNLLLSALYPKANRCLTRYPALLLLDMALMAFLLGASGGTASPYYFFALSPLLAAAFFFQVRGGLIAAVLFTPMYLFATLWAAQRSALPFNVPAASLQIVAFFAIAGLMGYPSVLLQRLREANLELYRAQDELTRAETLAAMGRLVAHVSHEIRNPLTTLGGYARKLTRKPDDVEAVRHHSRIIFEEVLRLEELLNDMLDLARPQRNTRQAASLHDLLDRACLLAGDLQAAKMTICKKYDEKMPPVEMDAPALLRAWLNIMRNAVQAMPDGGTLTICTERKGNRAHVWINDTGCGIAPELLPTIWTPFVTHRERGTGLGLAVTQQIIQEHGGSIDVESKVGQGTTFYFSLPVTIPTRPSTSTPGTSPQTPAMEDIPADNQSR